jgi:hypothetical protein
MLHVFTIGFFDTTQIRFRKLVPTQPLPNDLIEYFAENVQRRGLISEEEKSVVRIETYHMRCPWYWAGTARWAEDFALQAIRLFGCNVADLEHGRVIFEEELVELIGKRENNHR